jgi:hypothetical protein
LARRKLLNIDNLWLRRFLIAALLSFESDIDVLLSKNKGRRIASPGLDMLQLKNRGQVLSALGFRSCNLVQLSSKSNLYPGRRPKQKAVPKVKIKKGGKAAGNHEAIFANKTAYVKKKLS